MCIGEVDSVCVCVCVLIGEVDSVCVCLCVCICVKGVCAHVYI